MVIWLAPSPTTNAPVVAFRNSRRANTEWSSASCMIHFLRFVRRHDLLRGALNGRENPRIRPAPAQMTVHRRPDLRFAGTRVLEQQLGAFDDLSVVAIAALHRLLGDERFLQGMELRR